MAKSIRPDVPRSIDPTQFSHLTLSSVARNMPARLMIGREKLGSV
jgi:hypothetical protein